MHQRLRTQSKGFEPAFLEALQGDAPGVLCGSGLSIFCPTGLQGGHKTSVEIANVLCKAAKIEELCTTAGAPSDTFHKAITSAAYEAILQQYPKKDVLPGLFQNYFLRHGGEHGGATVRFNPLHQALASLLAKDRIRGIVTTNYDTCIEDAYLFAKNDQPHSVVVTEASPGEARPILKLHGCARQPESMIFSLDQEGELPEWKRTYLKSIAGGHLVVMGYSGLDFEVCPELYDLDLERITWIALQERGRPLLTANAVKVLKKKARKAVVISGDIRDVLVAWSGLGRCEKADDLPLLSDQIFAVLSESDRRLWAAKTFVVLSIPSAAAHTVEVEKRALGSSDVLSDEFKNVELGILNHSMRYFENADLNHVLARDGARELLDRIGNAIGESGSSSMAGAYDRSASALQYARELANGLDDPVERESVEYGIEWMDILLSKRSIVRSDRKAVGHFIERLRALQKRAYRVGNHHLIDLCEQEITQISGLRQRRPDIGMQKRSGQIFKQLGNYVGQVTALHTQALKTMKPSFAAQLWKRTRLMRLYGLPPWRVYQTLIELDRERQGREELFALFLESITPCQFDGNYKQAMIAKASRAVDSPHVLREHSK